MGETGINWDMLGAIGELAGGIVVIVSVIYLSRQIRLNTEQTRLASVQAINASNDSAFDPIYIPENTGVFAKGQASFSGLSDQERVLFDMLMTRLIASFDTTTYQYSKGTYDYDLYWGTAKFFSSFVTSPGGAEWLLTREEAFSDVCLHHLRDPNPDAKD